MNVLLFLIPISIVLLLIGLYGMMVKQNLMKKVFGLNIFQGAIILFFIVLAISLVQRGVLRDPK
mgnify:CR=1 FL=1